MKCGGSRARIALNGRAASAKRLRRPATTTRLAGLRHVFDIAVHAGVIYANPAEKLERMPVRQRELSLPDPEQFLHIIVQIETAGDGVHVIAPIWYAGWHLLDCAKVRQHRSSGRT